MAHDVFVSYHTDTAKNVADAVVTKLEQNGIRCWYAPRDVEDHFAGSIKRAIDRCRVFIVILNKAASESEHVMDEIAIAKKKRDKKIIPFHIADTDISDDAEYYLGRFHWVDGMNRDFAEALEDLCARTAKALGKTMELPAVETIEYPDGRVYTGQMKDGKRHGIGRQVWPDGGTYEGAWQDDKRTGQGKHTWANGHIYEGDFVDGTLNGKGKYIWENGNVYEGDFVDGRRTGKGKYTWKSGNVYEGDFVDGRGTGKGKYIWTSGNVYEGDFVDGKFRGKGRKTWKNGAVYEGDYADGQPNGFGTLTRANGEKLTGRFENNKYIGPK